jgi:ABC-2 type transport system permease protein
MSSSIVTRLVLKDLYLYRWMIGAAVVLGLASVLVAPLNRVGFGIGGMFYLTTVIAFGVIIVMYGVVQERKDKAVLFVMSLPLSGEQYLRAKLLAVLTTFLIPWATLTLAAAVVIAVTRLPDGLLSYLALVAVFMLMNFCVVLGIALRTFNEVAIGSTVIVSNLSVSLFFMGLANVRSIQDIAQSPLIGWTPLMSAILAIEIVLTLLALTVPFWFRRGGQGPL